MKRSQIKLYDASDYDYAYGDFIPTLDAYLHDDAVKRPAILLAPGGGYLGIAAIEAHLVTMSYFKVGFNVFVLTYSVNTLNIKPLKLQPLKDISRAICNIRKNSKDLRIIEDQIITCGFSAGGHLVASLAVHYNDIAIKHPLDLEISNKPNLVILGYPVITTGKYGLHRCIKTLLGDNASNDELNYMSLEQHVSKNTPPVFIWHTKTDEIVSVENSILFNKACLEAGVKCEMHLFEQGPHGMSIATKECLGNDYHRQAPYTFMQMFEDLKFGVTNYPNLLPKELNIIPNLNLEQFIEAFIDYKEKPNDGIKKKFVNEDVAKWFTYSLKFIDEMFINK